MITRLLLLVCLAGLVACAEESAAPAPTPEPAAAPEAAAPDYGDSGLGLRPQTLFDEEGVEPPTATYPTAPPGTSQVLSRAYPLAPPQIPHSTMGLLPITKDGNACQACHMPAVAAAMRATAIPVSHMNGDAISNARYNCSQCHVPQANVGLLVQNDFGDAE